MPREVSFRRARFPCESTPVVLLLVAATYDLGEAYLTLVFSRAVAIGVFMGSQIELQDRPGEALFQAPGYEQLGPETIRLSLDFVGACPAGASVLLSASATTGIVAADDATPWGGVSDVELPFP